MRTEEMELAKKILNKWTAHAVTDTAIINAMIDFSSLQLEERSKVEGNYCEGIKFSSPLEKISWENGYRKGFDVAKNKYCNNIKK